MAKQTLGFLSVVVAALASTAVRAAEPPLAAGMVGSPGVDVDGYPLATADKRVSLRLCRARKFDALEDWLNDLQAQFEADWHKEYWPMDALDAFGNPDPALNALLDEWVARKPDSYMALAARGIHAAALGWRARGGKWADETPPENFQKMRQEHAVAFPDLDDALTAHPALLAVHRALIGIAMANSATLALKRRLLDQALLQCPDCFQVRVAFILGLRPRWSGTYGLMQAFADESTSRSSSSKMRLLAGYADMDRCNLLKRVPARAFEALAACNQAVSLGETAGFLTERARVQQKSNPPAALADVNRALALRPQDVDALSLRAWLLGRAHDHNGQARDVALLRELDPMKKIGKHDLAWAAQSAANAAGRARQQDDQIAELERAIALHPDDLDTHLRLDDALVQAGERQRIPPIWRRYLARHPRDGRAHLELAGALQHLGEGSAAIAEAGIACRLGQVIGCALVARQQRR